MSTEISTAPCETDVTVIRGDYAAWRVEIGSSPDCPPVDLTLYNYVSEVYLDSRDINEENPCGSAVYKEKVADIDVELKNDEDPPVIVCSLSAEATAAIPASCCYQWRLQWLSGSDTNSIKTITRGSFKVV